MIVCNSRIVFKMENLSSSYLQVFYKNEMLKMVDPIVTITWEYLDLQPIGIRIHFQIQIEFICGLFWLFCSYGLFWLFSWPFMALLVQHFSDVLFTMHSNLFDVVLLYTFDDYDRLRSKRTTNYTLLTDLWVNFTKQYQQNQLIQINMKDYTEFL